MLNLCRHLSSASKSQRQIFINNLYQQIENGWVLDFQWTLHVIFFWLKDKTSSKNKISKEKRDPLSKNKWNINFHVKLPIKIKHFTWKYVPRSEFVTKWCIFKGKNIIVICVVLLLNGLFFSSLLSSRITQKASELWAYCLVAILIITRKCTLYNTCSVNGLRKPRLIQSELLFQSL